MDRRTRGGEEELRRREDLLAKASGGAAPKSLAPPGATATSEVARAFDGVLESKDGASVDPAKALGGKVVALYFLATSARRAAASRRC